MSIRCTSTGFFVALRTASTTTGPIVMFGTKRPSMTSTWIQSAPASSTARTSAASRPKSTDKIEGETMTGRLICARLSRDRAPLPPAAPQQIVGGLGPRASRRVGFDGDSLVVVPQIEDRLHDLPSCFDTVGPIEQHCVADHAVIDEGFVAGGGLGVEIILVRKIHPHAAEGNFRTGNLRAELHRCPLVGLGL